MLERECLKAHLLEGEGIELSELRWRRLVGVRLTKKIYIMLLCHRGICNGPTPKKGWLNAEGMVIVLTMKASQRWDLCQVWILESTH